MHLLSSLNLSKNDIEKIFSITDSIKKRKVYSLKDNMLALLFEKQSTRTRLSFEGAITSLGGNASYIDATTTHLSRGETLGDTARVISLFADFIAARMYAQEDLIELASHSKVPVINALTDLEHPCQALSDFYTIKEIGYRIKGLKFAFIGDIAANTANSLMITGAKLGAKITLIGPKSVKPNTKYVNNALRFSQVVITDDIKKGLSGADVIYTDTFVSMGKENEAARRRRIFKNYQVTRKAVKYASSEAVVMHCLPAHRGEEIAADVIDGPRSIVWQQAENKMHVEKAILLYLSEKSKKSL